MTGSWRLLVISVTAGMLSARPTNGAVSLNEILGSTPGSDREFIELYNSGPGSEDISGWQIELWDSDAGSTFGGADGNSPYVIPLSTTLSAGGFYLLANTLAESEYGVTADVVLPSNAIENSSYTVILRDDGGSIVDTVFVTDGDLVDEPNDAGTPIVAGASIGPDGSFLPAGFYRVGDGGAALNLLEFANPAPSATPGGPNPSPDILVLEVAPGCVGPFVEVRFWMRNLSQNASGFQAFLQFDDAMLAYRGDLSEYSLTPFPMHIQDIVTAEVIPGGINLDGSDVFNGSGTDADSLLATLVFEAVDECDETGLGYRVQGPFSSELSFEGLPIPTVLLDSRLFFVDHTPPVAGCSATDKLVDGSCQALVDFGAVVTDNCCISAVALDFSATATIPGGNAVVGDPELTSASQVNSTTVTLGGQVDVSALTSCPATVEISLQVSDCCDNPSVSCVAVANVNDETDPTIACPPTTSLQCTGELPPPATDLSEFEGIGGSAADNCGIVTVSNPGSVQGGSGCLVDPLIVVRTYQADDTCGNSITCKHVIEVTDTTSPVITCPADTSIECDESLDPYANPALGTATATDNCAGIPTVTFEDVVSAGSCAQESIVTRAWTATDGCGNESSCVQTITVLDTTGPVLGDCPGDIVTNADAGGCEAVVTWTDPTATDNCDPAPVVACVPPSGSSFAVGTTAVSCTATDGCGNSSSCAFDVTVEAENSASLEIDLAGVNIPVTRCIRLVTNNCSDITDIELSFADHDGDDANMNGVIDSTEGTTDERSTSVRAVQTVEIPCGAWTQLCAKDEQHTVFGTTTLTDSGTQFVGDGMISLAGGDSDNDSDVDVGDVSFLLASFGDLALSGGCPWDGTRDADFSDNGAVGSEDYTFLTANWLLSTSCPCTTMPPQTGLLTFLGIADSDAGQAAVADLNADGFVDYRDVEIFETRRGLGHLLSFKMRRSMRYGDFDGDTDVDLIDFALFARAFGKGTGGENAVHDRYDVNADGRIDLADFAAFAANFDD